MVVLSWNLFHGRAVPGAGRDLLDEYAAAISGWEWDVALLQEVPPWWPDVLAAAAGAAQRTALTSRNALPPLRRWAARRWPDVVKSNGGGANAILARPPLVIAEHRRRRLRLWPERRVVHAVRLAEGPWIANLHAQVHSERRAQADLAAAVAAVRSWSAGTPFVIGGDLNVRVPRAGGLGVVGGHGVDHVLAEGFEAAGPVRTPHRGGLSDHAPVLIKAREGSPEGQRR